MKFYRMKIIIVNIFQIVYSEYKKGRGGKPTWRRPDHNISRRLKYWRV
jgi:hypothetical protein